MHKIMIYAENICVYMYMPPCMPPHAYFMSVYGPIYVYAPVYVYGPMYVYAPVYVYGPIYVYAPVYVYGTIYVLPAARVCMIYY